MYSPPSGHSLRLHRWSLLSFGLVGLALFSSPARSEEPIQQPATRPPLTLDGAILKTIKTTALAAQVSGVVKDLAVKEGTRVIAGEEIGKVNDLAIRIQAEKAKTSLEIAKRKQVSDIDKRLAEKHQAVAKNEYERALAANAKVVDVYPKNEVDRLKLVYDRTTLELERAIHQQELLNFDVSLADLEVKQSQELLDRHRILSPTSGIIVSLERKPGEWVDPGDPIVNIVEIDPLRIEGFLTADNAPSDLVGAKAQVEVEVSGKVIQREAELVFISPEVNPLNSQVRVYLEVKNTDGRLRPGLRPKVVFSRLEE